jgi:predicted MFS family arabinose efflux permease
LTWLAASFSWSAVFSLSVEERGRLNALYMTIFFMGGAVGSALAGYAYAQGGWSYVTDIGLIAMIVAFIYFLTERN